MNFKDDYETGRGRVRRQSRRSKQGQTGSEAAYLRSLVDSRRTVTVLLRSGEKLRGRVRYADRSCFSIRLEPDGPNILVRKASVQFIEDSGS